MSHNIRRMLVVGEVISAYKSADSKTFCTSQFISYYSILQIKIYLNVNYTNILLDMKAK